MSIATQISRLTSIRNSIKSKLISLGLLQESNGGQTPSTKSGTSQSGNVVIGDDLEACKQAINSINETTPYLLSSTGAKNVAGYKYAQVDTTVFEPIGSSGSINPNAQNAYIGASGGISASAPSGSAPVSLGQISPSGNYQGMSAVNLLYDSNVIKAENIRNGVSIFNITGNYVGSLGVADLRSTGGSSSTSRHVLTIDLDEVVPNFSRSNILSMSGYNLSMSDNASSNFNDKIASFYLIGDSSQFAKAIISQSNGTWLSPTDLSLTITSYEYHPGRTRVAISITSEENKFKGVYMIAMVYTK